MRKGDGATMTDKQLEVIVNFIADKFEGCRDMEEVRHAIQEIRDLAWKKKSEGSL